MNLEQDWRSPSPALIPGGGGAPVQVRHHRPGSGQRDHGRRHAGGGEHQRASHGNAADPNRTGSPLRGSTNPSPSLQGPEDFYEGITFEHFEQVWLHFQRSWTCFCSFMRVFPPQILKGLEMESRMHIRFLDTTTVHCGKSWENRFCKACSFFEGIEAKNFDFALLWRDFNSFLLLFLNSESATVFYNCWIIFFYQFNCTIS